MCGIVGYIGPLQAQPVLFSSLTRLEYRGYDSSGIAIRGSGIVISKDAVRVRELQKQSRKLQGTAGIGHTRWATHGSACMINSHPHTDCTGKIAVVHNGVINNYQELREQLTAEGHHFVSDTDTEVIPHLIEKYYNGNLENAVTRAINDLDGSYALAIICEEEAKVVVARQDSPLVLGIGNNEYYIASDIPALLHYTNEVVFLENGDIGTLTEQGMRLYNHGQEVARHCHHIGWRSEDTSCLGYEHFMLKEICEQPRVINNTLNTNDFEKLWPGRPVPSSLLIVACGSSYHAGCVGEYILEELLGIPVSVRQASELNYRLHYPVTPYAIFITQSGETADVLIAMKKFRQAGTRCIVITNVPNSTASRMADEVLYINAGPEISVAATKSFTAQLLVLYQFGLYFHERYHPNGWGVLNREIESLSGKIQKIINHQNKIIACAEHLAESNNAFFIGRGINYPVALEGALKLKEVSYIHAEACAAGELKHGPLALLEKNTPVLAITTPDVTLTAMLTSIKEVKAREACVIALVSEECPLMGNQADMLLEVPKTHPLLSPIVNAVVLQLLAYHTARIRNCPIDFPRNLAKSVTVE